MNYALFNFFYSFANQSSALDKLIIFVAKDSFGWVVVAAAVFLLLHHEIFNGNPIQTLRQKYKEILLVLVSAVAAWVVAHIVKSLYVTPRPFEAIQGISALFGESGSAFPSGHASFFMGLAFAIYFYHKKAGYAFMLIALLIGVARIASGVHFPIDILGGFILGAATAWLSRKLYVKFA